MIRPKTKKYINYLASLMYGESVEKVKPGLDFSIQRDLVMRVYYNMALVVYSAFKQDYSLLKYKVKI